MPALAFVGFGEPASRVLSSFSPRTGRTSRRRHAPSLRGGEADEAIHEANGFGLLRFARNDGFSANAPPSKPPQQPIQIIQLFLRP
jgi:hypothetical protein